MCRQCRQPNLAALTFGPILIDKTPPVLLFGAASPGANPAGWNNTNVAVPFTASDVLSGLASITPAVSPLVLAAEGSVVAGSVTVTDRAGNEAHCLLCPPLIHGIQDFERIVLKGQDCLQPKSGFNQKTECNPPPEIASSWGSRRSDPQPQPGLSFSSAYSDNSIMRSSSWSGEMPAKFLKTSSLTYRRTR